MRGKDSAVGGRGRWTDAAFRQVDIAWLVYFRVFFGAMMLIEVWRYFDHDWIRAYYIDPKFLFTYPGFGWLHPWPGQGMYVHFAALGVVAALQMIGRWYRVAASLFFLGFTYVFLLDQTNYLNHFYLLSLVSFLLVFLPAHRALSWDVARRPEIASATAPAWCLWAVRALVGIPYFYGGVAKINYDWLRGEPIRDWLADRKDFPLLGPYFEEEWMVYTFTYGGLLLDLLAVPALLWRRTRALAFLVLVAFHLLNAKLFDIGIFPWFMIGATAVYFDPAWPRFGGLWKWPDTYGRREETSLPRGRGVFWLLGLFFAIQMLLPLRHFLYPDSVHWTERGHNFAWHMKLRSKSGRATFQVTDRGSGETWTVQPREHLSSRQATKMCTRPEMIRQFARYLADVYRREGRDVEVRAQVQVSLNSRKSQPLVDPGVDLVRAEGHGWLVPLAE